MAPVLVSETSGTSPSLQPPPEMQKEIDKKIAFLAFLILSFPPCWKWVTAYCFFHKDLNTL